MKRRRFLTWAAAVAALAGAGTLAIGTDVPTSSDEAAAAEAPDLGDHTIATVERGDLGAEREFRAAVSFGDRWALTTAGSGTITGHHEIGTVIGFGEELVRIDDRPLFLGQGAMPMYRELSKVDTRQRDENGDRLELLTGFDVAQLQYFLIEAGFDAAGDLEVDGSFGASTEKAVKAWQESAGLPVTGKVDNGQIVFSPNPVRVASSARIGAPFAELQVNNAESTVLVDTSARDRSAFEIGQTVEVKLLDESIRDGTVVEQEQVSAADGATIWRTTIDVAAELSGDAASATVTVTDVVARDVVIVPVGALLALAEGGFALEVVTDTGTSLVGVAVGHVLDGQAEVTGDISPGDRVVVAG